MPGSSTQSTKYTSAAVSCCVSSSSKRLQGLAVHSLHDTRTLSVSPAHLSAWLQQPEEQQPLQSCRLNISDMQALH